MYYKNRTSELKTNKFSKKFVIEVSETSEIKNPTFGVYWRYFTVFSVDQKISELILVAYLNENVEKLCVVPQNTEKLTVWRIEEQFKIVKLSYFNHSIANLWRKGKNKKRKNKWLLVILRLFIIK